MINKKKFLLLCTLFFNQITPCIISKVFLQGLNIPSAYFILEADNFEQKNSNLFTRMVYETVIDGAAAEYTGKLFAELINCYFPNNKIPKLADYSTNYFVAWMDIFNFYFNINS
jgi:hypothetical protein